MQTLAGAVQHYLDETLGVPAQSLRAPAGTENLPYFLRDAFELCELDLYGQRCLLAIERHPGQSTMGEIRTKLHSVQSHVNLPTIYVTDALASYERKRLIEQKVPFIVPGNQMYLPDLGLDLREYFRKRQSPRQVSFSPSAQALLITALLRPVWEIEWQPSDVVEKLGYSAMTRSRAIRELTAAGIVEVANTGRSKVLKFAYPPEETWQRARPMLRTPIKRSFFSLPPDAFPQLPKRVAGMSALARCTMLSESKWPVFALTQQTWNSFWPRVEELPEHVAGAIEWQVWQYSPALEPSSEAVDPYSLILSVQDDKDERIQIALDELEGQLPW